MINPPIISIIIVTTNAEKHIFRCIESIYNFLPKEFFEVIVSDNSSEDNTINIVSNNFPKTKILIGDNVGYGAGNNRGVKVARGDYVLILNDDTYFIDDTLIEMTEFLGNSEDVGIVGPMLLNSDFSIQPSITLFPRIFKDILQILFPYTFSTSNQRLVWLLRQINRIIPLFQIGRYDKHNQIKQAEAVKGACMLVKKSVFITSGGFDENIFLDTDEQALCARALAIGYKTYYYPRSKLVHIGGASIGSTTLFNTGNRVLQKYKSNIHFFKIYKRWPLYIIYQYLMLTFIGVRIIMLYVSINILNNKRDSFELKILVKLVLVFASDRYRALNMFSDINFKTYWLDRFNKSL